MITVAHKNLSKHASPLYSHVRTEQYYYRVAHPAIIMRFYTANRIENSVIWQFFLRLEVLLFILFSCCSGEILVESMDITDEQ